jgi:pimeloyl-ACP methyl ester carboxylesterase
MGAVTTTPLLGYDRAGSGEPLLLLHGFGTSRADFTGLVPELARDFDVMSMDLPGHGSSPMIEGIPTVAALTDAVARDIDALGLERVHILGNSLGGRVAIELARRRRALSVVSISPSGLGTPGERVHQGTLMVISRMINRGRRPWIDELAESPAGRSLLLAGMRALPWQATAAEATAVKSGFADQDGFWGTLWHAIMLDVPTGLNGIDCPVVVAQGSFDVVGSGQTPRYTPLIPDARFVLLPIAGHAPQSDTPDTIIDLTRWTAQRSRHQTASPDFFTLPIGPRALVA